MSGKGSKEDETFQILTKVCTCSFNSSSVLSIFWLTDFCVLMKKKKKKKTR